MFKRIISIILVLYFIVSLISCSASKDMIKDDPEDSIIGFVSVSNSELAAKSYAKEGAQIVGYNTLSDLLLAIENGYVNYGVLSDYECVVAANAERKLEVYEECSFKIDLCAYFRNDSSELRDEFNESITKMKDNGKIDKIKDFEYNGVTYHSLYTGEGNKELKVLCNPSTDLFLYLTDDGSFAGIDSKILETFAEENEYSLSYISVLDDNELFSKLDNGEGDMIISAVEFDEDRVEYYLASDVYFTINFNLVTRKAI